MQHHERAFEHLARSDVDDLAVALAAHHRQHRLDAFERPARIDRHHPVPFLRRDLGERLLRDLAEEGGVVDQHLDAAERLLGCLHQRRHRLGVAHIAHLAHHIAARRVDRLHDRDRRIDVAHAHPRALRR